MFEYVKPTWSEGDGLLPAARLVPLSVRPRRIARRLAIATLLAAVFVAFAPWRQNLRASGAVVAFSPDERPQEVQATISGRVMRWAVAEGTRVSAGDLLVELSDNDPQRLARMELERDAARQRVESYEGQVLAYEERVTALREAQEAQLEAARAKVRVARESLADKRELLAAAELQESTAARQQERIRGLAADGLSSDRDAELAELSATRASASLRSARAELRAAEGKLSTERASLEQTRASTEASLRSAIASLRSAETSLASARASLARAESALAQQEQQLVTAPRDGIVQRIYVQSGQQISRGTTLATLVPEVAASRAVALYVDGNDAALVAPGAHVRLQFEGWPALQFGGWPAAAAGTFGGTVTFVDPADDGRGDFRVMIVPDEEGDPWPDARFLRQGTRAKGWLLLEEVRVGYEIWRQLNGFPPNLPDAAYPAGGGASY